MRAVAGRTNLSRKTVMESSVIMTPAFPSHLPNVWLDQFPPGLRRYRLTGKHARDLVMADVNFQHSGQPGGYRLSK
jgi:hypothetical protein